MTTFVLLALLMVVIALALLLPAFWRIPKTDATDRASQNIAILKEQLAMLEDSLAKGEVTQEQYQQTRDELEASLLQDTESEATPLDNNILLVHGRWTSVMLALILPIFIFAGYAMLGTPKVFDKTQMQVQQSPPHAEGNQKMPSLDVMLARLEQKLIDQPDNLDGWMMAGRSYMSLKRFADAKRVLQKAYELASDNPVVMLRYADALAMSRGGHLSGEPFSLIKKALVKSPDNVMALWLAGLAYEEQADHQNAISHWQRAAKLVQPGSESLQEINGMIARVQQKLSGNTPVVSQAENLSSSSMTSLKVSVSLDPKFKAQANPNDIVFIYAKAASGPPMPLAAVRKNVKDLPLVIKLDDSMAMMPAMKLSSFKNVVVSARVSKTGSAVSAPGDMIGQTTVLTLPVTEKLNIKIDQVIK